MILVDVNLLLYTYDAGAAQHKAARQWLESVTTAGEALRVAWATVLAFLRLSTRRGVLAEPLSMSEARSVVDEWFAQGFLVLEPGDRHWSVLQEALAAATHPDLVTDAHLAALAIEHGALLCTNDRDFTRFPRLKVRFPLQEPA